MHDVSFVLQRLQHVSEMNGVKHKVRPKLNPSPWSWTMPLNDSQAIAERQESGLADSQSPASRCPKINLRSCWMADSCSFTSSGPAGLGIKDALTAASARTTAEVTTRTCATPWRKIRYSFENLAVCIWLFVWRSYVPRKKIQATCVWISCTSFVVPGLRQVNGWDIERYVHISHWNSTIHVQSTMFLSISILAAGYTNYF
jgi:hypothetical protein